MIMKKYIALLLSISILAFMLSTVNASPILLMRDTQIISLQDGGYIIIEIENSNYLARASTSMNKIFTRYNDVDEIVWKATLTGYFTYDGRTASCTSCSCVVTDFDDGWYTISKSAWTDDNIAKATIEMGRKSLGVTVRRETHNLSMVCDRYGNVS